LAVKLLASVPGHRSGNITEKLGHAHPAIAVPVAGSGQTLEQMVRKKPMAKLLCLQRFLTLIAGCDQKASLAANRLKQGRSKLEVARGRGNRIPEENLAGMTTVKTNHHGSSIDAVDPAANVAHGHAARDHILRVGIVRKQEAFVLLPDSVHHAVSGKVNQNQLGVYGLGGQPLR